MPQDRDGLIVGGGVGGGMVQIHDTGNSMRK